MKTGQYAGTDISMLASCLQTRIDAG